MFYKMVQYSAGAVVGVLAACFIAILIFSVIDVLRHHKPAGKAYTVAGDL